jgi:hypothetical protein
LVLVVAAVAGGAVSPRGGDGATEAPAPTEAANSEVTAGRLLLEAFVCIDVDLAFHGHESPAGRGLPGKWVGRVAQRFAARAGAIIEELKILDT